jgi:mannose-6-phosphate isomerase-like protein (cupin superfamily)
MAPSAGTTGHFVSSAVSGTSATGYRASAARLEIGDEMAAAPDTVVNLDEKFSLFNEHWSPKIVGQINDLHVKVVKVQGEFVWHAHEETDEFFLVLSGRLRIEMRGHAAVSLGPGEFFVVPRGIEHRPLAAAECQILLLEPVGVVNTGDATETTLTAGDEWI